MKRTLPRAAISGADTSDLVALHRTVSMEIARRLEARLGTSELTLPEHVATLRITRRPDGSDVAAIDATEPGGSATYSADTRTFDAHRGIGMQRVHVLVRDVRRDPDIAAVLGSHDAVALVTERLVLPADAGALFDVLVDAESVDGAVEMVRGALEGEDGLRVLPGAAPTHQPAIRAAFRQAGFAVQSTKSPRRSR